MTANFFGLRPANRRIIWEGMYDDYDRCYECSAYGDDYYIDDDGELVCYCPECQRLFDDEWYDDEWD